LAWTALALAWTALALAWTALALAWTALALAWTAEMSAALPLATGTAEPALLGLATTLCSWLRLGWCRLDRNLCRGGAFVLVGFFCHSSPYSFNPASRTASAKALTFP